MPRSDWWVYMMLGGVFILLGIVGMFWAHREEERYDSILSRRPDVREYLDHWPPRVEFGAIRVGGWVAIAVGVVLMGLGSAFLLWQ